MGKKYSLTEAAKELLVTRQSIHLAIKKGKLPGTLTTRTVEVYTIDEKDLNAYRVDRTRQRSGKKTVVCLTLSSEMNYKGACLMPTAGNSNSPGGSR